MKEQCVVVTTNSIEKFGEKRCSLSIRNLQKRKLLRKKVDGCLIVDGKRCDWMLEDFETGVELFIELKGVDVGEGIKQISASVEALSKGRGVKKYAYLICTRSPLSSPQIQKLQKTMLRDYGVELRVRTLAHVEDISALI